MGKNGNKNGNNATAIVPVNQYQIMQIDPAEIAEIVKANAGNLGFSDLDFDRVTMPTGGQTTWTIPKLTGDVTQPEIVGIVVAFKDARLMWNASYAETGGGSPPDCKSIDGLNGIGTPGGECAVCPLAQFGSDGRGQKCGQYRYLFVMRADDILPLLVSLPPTSVRGCQKFMLRMANSRLRYCDAVLGIGLEVDKNQDGLKFSKATFRVVSELSEDERVRTRALSDQIKALIGRMDVSGQAARPADNQ